LKNLKSQPRHSQHSQHNLQRNTLFFSSPYCAFSSLQTPAFGSGTKRTKGAQTQLYEVVIVILAWFTQTSSVPHSSVLALQTTTL